MQSKLNPYLSFKDNTREAMEFYKTVFGGKLELHTFKEYNASQDPSEDNKIMHSMLEADNEAELKNYFDKLSSGGMVTMLLEKAPWGDTFGMCADKFGVQWMVNIVGQKA